MLLPSDVARLVLGYLQQEKLLTTCRTFIVESSDLKEYAEHCTGEGFVPACLLSLFGKNLTTILNEYITMKTKETSNDVPAMMSSLWKKLDYTLSQIRSMQNSSGFSAHQRSRTRSAIADMKKQKCLQPSASSHLGSSCLSLQPGQLNPAPVTATQVILKPFITPIQAQTRSSSASAHQPQALGSHDNRDPLCLASAAVQEQKLHSGVMSPGKRKSDSQKKKNVSSRPQSSTSSSEDSPTVEEESSPMEEESEPLEELIDGNFPQMVIENAREKILSNKCLQEKLAENINKFLGSDGTVSQIPKQPDSGPTIQESSIDEFLGLQQGEIHMTEEAIQEILEQTESDPAFQGLFDMFDFGKSKGNRNGSHGILAQDGGEENTMLVDEENLEVLETYIRTKEMSDGSQERLAYTGDHSKEATGSDVILEEHLKMQSIIAGEFQGISEVRTETASGDTGMDNQQLPHKPTFESEPDQVSAPEFSVHNTGSYEKQETTAGRTGIETDAGTDLLHQEVQNLPELQYEPLDAQQKSLSDGAECCSLPDNLLSEKTNAELLSPLHSGHSEMPAVTNVADSHCLEDSDKMVEQIAQGVPLFSAPCQQKPNSPTLSNFQDQNKLTLDSVTVPVVSAVDPAATALQLEVVDTSRSLHSDDQLVLEESCSKHQDQKSEDSEEIRVDTQDPSSSTKTGADSLFLPSNNERHTETPVGSNTTISTACQSPPPEPAGESSPETKAAGSVSSSTQATDEDPSNIVSLKIIISDDTFISSDAELNNAVSSITGENLPTIILSSPAKSPARITGPARCFIAPEETERLGDSALVEQNLLLLRSQDSVVSTLNVQNEECAVLSIAGTSSVAKDGGFIQLMPGASTSFGNSNSVYIATCVTEPAALSTNVTPSNLVMLPGNSTSLTSPVPTTQQLRTPPRTNNLFALNPPMSPNFSQGSAIIIASPVQPVLQGMVGMIPVSIMGQSGNAFSDPSRQVLHMPVQTSLCSGGVPKLPLPPKSQKFPRSKSNAGKLKMDKSGSDPVNRPGSRMQRVGNLEKNACANLRKKLEAVAVDTTSSNPKQNESHRRVLCFDNTLPGAGGSAPVSQKERSENSLLSGNSPSGMPSSPAKAQSSKRERERTLPRILCKPDIANRNTAVKEAQSERKASGPGLASDVLRKQTANKENEIERGVDKKSQNHEAASLSNGQQSINLHIEKNGSPAQELTKKQGLQLNANSKKSGVLTSKEPKDQTKSPSQGHCLTSPLTKQAVELLHDIQRHSPASKLPENGDLPVPRTPSGTGDRHSDDTFDIIRTPTCKRYTEDSTTPRIMVPPATPDLPACSPASETGSENSVSMAAHTLMILSRAAIARTNTPLKDNTQQFRSLRSTARKRKQEDAVECEKNSRAASKKDLQNFTVPIKKKKVKQKKLPVSFPEGMDVDKFLLSLHYDE
ncbi:protein NPAT isoform X2 [Eublepharis macularius]|uniref:Protein NPAT isoform X2 n=1 Tax=Eublepharis macularius TaxID=481883 RepID=A0AA97J0Q5_EUBMA|nr:protein NPAT isoform X2 [Eublepharis macularius]